MGCGASAGPYPAEFPASALPAGLAVLDQKDAAAVQQTVDVVARAFAGTATAAPPGEVSDCQCKQVRGGAPCHTCMHMFVSRARTLPLSLPAHECVHAPRSCVCVAMVCMMQFDWLLPDVPDRKDPEQLKERVHRLVAPLGMCMHKAFLLGERGLILVARDDSGGKITGCVVLYFYPKKYGVDGMMLDMKACSAAGMSKWSKTQSAIMQSKRMAALDAGCQKLHKAHGSTPHIFVQIVAVDPEEHGKGLGKNSMQAVNKIADDLKLPLYLECDGKNEAFYTKCGFAKVGTEDLTATEKSGPAVYKNLVAMRREVAPATVSVPN